MRPAASPPTSTSSSPVARIATRGRANTATPPPRRQPPLQSPSHPARRPAGTTTSPPALPLLPARCSRPPTSPRVPARRTTPSEPITCSTITTQSAPAGKPAPVMISTASPGRSAPRVHASPARNCPTTRSPPRRQIRGPAGKTIPRRPRKRRLIPIRRHRLCQHASRCVRQRAPVSTRPRRRALTPHPLRIPADHSCSVRRNPARSMETRRINSKNDCRKIKERRPPNSPAATPALLFPVRSSASSPPYNWWIASDPAPPAPASHRWQTAPSAPGPDTSGTPPRFLVAQQSSASSDRSSPC